MLGRLRRRWRDDKGTALTPDSCWLAARSEAESKQHGSSPQIRKHGNSRRGASKI